MKKQLGAIAFCGAMLFSSQFVMAQDHRQDSPQQQDHYQGRSDNNHYKGMSDQGQHEGWYKKGGRVPANYRGGQYAVSDWHSYHLKAPPRGYHYIRSDNGDFLLTAITTGAILSIVAGGH